MQQGCFRLPKKISVQQIAANEERAMDHPKLILITGVSLSSVWIYVWQGAVVWPAMVVLMAGSIGGGYAGGHLIRILPPRLVRFAIIAFGTGATALYAGRYWF